MTAAGQPIPFDALAVNIATITRGDRARDVVATWRKAGVPEGDLQQMCTDLRADHLHTQTTPEQINTRYQHFINHIAVENRQMRINYARLMQVLPE